MNDSQINDTENGPLPRRGRRDLARRPEVRRHLLRGLPALLAVLVVLGVTGAAAFSDQNQLRMHYFEQAARHFRNKDYQAARVGFERVVHEGGDLGTREVRYNLAVCLDVLGESDGAQALIDQLAPEDGVGFAPAHVWQARRLWAGTNHTPAQVRAGEEHLLRALKDAPNASEPAALLGQYYLAANRAEKALPYLESAAREQPEILLPLARAELALDRRIRARERAKEARELFKRRAEADLDDHDSRLRWVDADLILEDFPDAADALQREAILRSDPRYPQALAQVYLAWADSLGREDRSKVAERLVLLERGLALDPANMLLLGRFSDVIRAGGAEGDRARAALRALVARGASTGPVRYALGLDDWEHGRAAEARLHWEEACRLSPQVPAFANNLAWVMATGTNPDLPRALETINSVITRWPNDPRLRETRGQILARLRRWKEALPDLEVALTVYPDNPELHRTLAESYDHLDAPGMAAEHRKRAGSPQAAPNSKPADGTPPSASSSP